jgi:hypothetical protein
MYLGGTAECMPRLPDWHDGSNRSYCEISYWFPQNDELGRLYMEEHAGQLDQRGSAYAADIAPSVGLISEATPVSSLFRWAGLSVRRYIGNNTTYSTLTTPSPRQLDERLNALCVPKTHTPPRLAMHEGTIFPAKDFVRELLVNGRLLISESQPLAVHDIMAHAATNWMFLPPEHIEQLRNNAAVAHKGGEKAMTTFMDHLDQTLVNVGFGRTLLSALAYEAHGHNGYDPVPAGVETYWTNVGAMLCLVLQRRAINREEVRDLGQGLREHCRVLNAAADEALAAKNTAELTGRSHLI